MNKKKRWELLREYNLFVKNHTKLNYMDFLNLQTIGRLAKKHHKLAEDNCNGTIEEEDYLKQKEKIESKIKEVAGWFAGLNVFFQHNPRGTTVKLTHDKQSHQMTTDYYYLIGLR